MTLKDLLSQMGLGPKTLTERLSHADFGGGHDSVIYAYEPAHSSHHVASSKHHHGGGHKSNAAMSALTLLSFLFFLHILQQCLKDHMTTMTTPPLVVMTAGREGEEPISKSDVNKMDKAGKSDTDDEENTPDDKRPNDYENSYQMLKVNTAEHKPRFGSHEVKVFKNFGNKSLDYRGFVKAMDDVK